MTRLWWLLSLLILSLLCACSSPPGGGLGDDDDSAGDDDDDDATDDDDSSDDDDDTEPPAASIDSVHPEDGTTDHYIGEALWVDFDAATEDASITLGYTDKAAGDNVTGDSLWLSETRLRFTPTDLLDLGADYTATVVWAGGSLTQSWSFTTGLTGSEVLGSDMVGNSYSMNVTDGAVVAPAGAEKLLPQINATFLLSVTAQSASTLDLLGSTATEGSAPPEQNLCLATFDLSEKTETLWADPYFAGGPVDVSQTIDVPNLGALPLVFHDVEMTGVFTSSDGLLVDGITEGTFSAFIDISEVGFDCSVVASLVPGLSCSECPGQPGVIQCVVFDIIDIPGLLVPDLTLVPRSEQDITDDLNCG